MKTRVSNDEPHVWDVTIDGIDGTRPGGVRHEIEFCDGFVVFREVWYFSDSGEVQQCDERKIELNAAVHVMVNITDAECVEFSEVRTKRPEDPTVMSSVVKQERETLIEVLALWDTSPSFAANLVDIREDEKGPNWSQCKHNALVATNDAAKLAGLIVAEARKFGLKSEVCEPFAMFREQSWPMVQIDDDEYMFRLVSADMATSRRRLLTLLRLPKGASCEDAKKIIRGVP